MFRCVRHVSGLGLIVIALTGNAQAKTESSPDIDSIAQAVPAAQEGQEATAPLEDDGAEVERGELGGARPCSTNLSRSPDEVLVEVGEDFLPASPYKYVDVRSGESLCVNLTSETTGGVSIAAVAPAPESPAHLRLELTTVEEGRPDGLISTLSIRNHLDEALVLHLARPDRDSGILLFEKEIFWVAARSELVRGFAYHVERVLLASFPRTVEPTGSEQQESIPREDPLPVWDPPPPIQPRPEDGKKQGLPRSGVRGALDVYLIGGTIFNHSADLEATVVDNGFESVPHHQELLGFGVGGTFRRVRATLDILTSFPGTIEAIDAGADAKQRQLLISFEGGYEVFRLAGFSVFPLVGLTAGDVSVRTDPDNPALLPDQIAGYYNNPARIRQNVYSVRGTLAVQNITPLGDARRGKGLVYGLRVGYQQQFAQTKWLPPDDDPNAPALSGGPEVDTSGPYLHLLLGVSFFEW